MWSDEKQPWVMSLKSYDRTLTYEYPSSDINLDEALDAFYSLMIGATWSPEVILRGMKEFAEDKLEAYWPNEYKDENTTTEA